MLFFLLWFPAWACCVAVAAQFDRTRGWTRWLREAGARYRYGGFTLIELSIVLVIIGLIVGGVLVGQNLIAAAAMRAQITQIEQYNTAVNTFRDKYGGLPGDLALTSATQFGFNVTSCTGGQGSRDGNGLIDGAATPNIVEEQSGETGLFWSDLSLSHLIGGMYSPSGNNGCGFSGTIISATNAGQYFPSGKIGNANFIYVYDYMGYNWFGLSSITYDGGSTTPLYSAPGLTVAQAYSIDTKIDDGLPTSGRVQALSINGSTAVPYSAPSAAADSAATCFNTTNLVYSLTVNNGNGVNCALSFKMQAGD